MLTADFDYSLPDELIAQQPSTSRSGSKLLVLQRPTGLTQHTTFDRFHEHLHPGDLLVLNNSRVIPARLRATKPITGGQLELFLLEPAAEGGWWTLLRPGKRVRPGSTLHLLPPSPSPVEIQVSAKNPDGHCRIVFPEGFDVIAHAQTHGEMPLPPYIRRPSPDPDDSHRYQTVYAREPGSVAAPTAGLHFDTDSLQRLRQSGIAIAELTLHVGVGTFAPVKAERLEDHTMHFERFEIPETTARQIRETKAAGGRVIAVGTTSLRVLEASARSNAGRVASGTGRTDLFLYPPAAFQVADALLTNFHLPRSTLLMLISAFADPGGMRGRDMVLAAYREAIDRRFRFFSFGDAMFLC